jgi:hypothetical protein
MVSNSQDGILNIEPGERMVEAFFQLITMLVRLLLRELTIKGAVEGQLVCNICVEIDLLRIGTILFRPGICIVLVEKSVTAFAKIYFRCGNEEGNIEEDEQ